MLTNETSWGQLATFCQTPGHALLVTGEVETATLAANTVASTLLGVDIQQLAEHQNVLLVGLSEESIGIDAIRQLIHFTRLTVPSKRTIARVCIVHHAEKLTHESQNALLKLLEEPPKNTVIILSTAHQSALLPTVISRTRRIHIQAPSLQEATRYYHQQGFAPEAITRAYSLANGHVGILDQTLNEAGNETAVGAVEDVKSILSLPMSARLRTVGELSKDSARMIDWLDALERVCHGAMLAAAKKGSLASCKRWHNALKLTFQARANISKNGSPKLILTDLLLHM